MKLFFKTFNGTSQLRKHISSGFFLGAEGTRSLSLSQKTDPRTPFYSSVISQKAAVFVVFVWKTIYKISDRLAVFFSSFRNSSRRPQNPILLLLRYGGRVCPYSNLSATGSLIIYKIGFPLLELMRQENVFFFRQQLSEYSFVFMKEKFGLQLTLWYRHRHVDNKRKVSKGDNRTPSTHLAFYWGGGEECTFVSGQFFTVFVLLVRTFYVRMCMAERIPEKMYSERWDCLTTEVFSYFTCWVAFYCISIVASDISSLFQNNSFGLSVTYLLA